MKLLTDLFNYNIGGGMPLWVLLIIIAAVALGLWGLWHTGRDSQRFYASLDEFRQRVQAAGSRSELLNLQRELACMVDDHAWHRYHFMAARQLRSFIEGRLTAVSVTNDDLPQGIARNTPQTAT